MARVLDPGKHVDKQKSIQISNQRRRLRLKKVTEPFEISPETVKKFG
jgi:hypothetical protein